MTCWIGCTHFVIGYICCNCELCSAWPMLQHIKSANASNRNGCSNLSFRNLSQMWRLCQGAAISFRWWGERSRWRRRCISARACSWEIPGPWHQLHLGGLSSTTHGHLSSSSGCHNLTAEQVASSHRYGVDVPVDIEWHAFTVISTGQILANWNIAVAYFVRRSWFKGRYDSWHIWLAFLHEKVEGWSRLIFTFSVKREGSLK